MAARLRSGAPVLFSLAAALVMVACSKKNAPATEAPAGASYPGADAAPEAGGDNEFADDPQDFDGLQAQLASLEDELEAAGVAVDGREAGVPVSANPKQCLRICDLADAICDLEASICTLAADHEDQARYADACTRVQSDCKRAQEACSGCSDR